MWDNLSLIELDPMRCSGFLGDDEFVYGPLPTADVKVEAAEVPPAPKREIFCGEDISGKETWDDIDEYLGYLTYMAEKAKGARCMTKRM
jgi:hypothetical protein